MLAASIIALMMEAASTSETSVNFYQTTRRSISEDSHLQQKESLKQTALHNLPKRHFAPTVIYEGDIM
jgi:hypothetical protein